MKSLNIGDMVIHYREGLSTVEKIVKIGNDDYYLLRTNSKSNDDIYVPVNKYDCILRDIIDIADIEDLILSIKNIKPEYVTNTKQRRDSFKKKLISGNILDLAYLSRQLYFFLHPEKLKIPVKFGPADVEMLKSANKMLYDELSISMSIDRNDIESHILKLINS